MCSDLATRRARRRPDAALLGWFVSAAISCGANAPAPKSAADLSPRSLYPLAQRCAWAYDVDSGDGQPVLATARVTEVDGARVTVRTGQAVQHYELLPTGIARLGPLGQRSLLLETPIEPNASWSSGPETQARVLALHERFQSAAGSFDDCVRIEEQNAGSGQTITTTYCPGVGPVRVVSQMQVRGHALAVTASLRGFSCGTP